MTDLEPEQGKQIRNAVSVLRDGGIIAYPTEAVYGLGCDPDNLAALERLLDLKQRDPGKGLIIVAADFDQVTRFIAPIDEETLDKVKSSWPGPVTWLLPVDNSISPLLYGKHYTIAIRVSAHPLVQQLCRAFGGAIVSTSANPSFKDPARTATQVRDYFGDRIGTLVEGELGDSGKPTEIRNALTGEVIRAG